MKVTLPYDPMWLALDWAKKHCPSYTTMIAEPVEPRRSLSDAPAQIYVNYYFSDERDVTMFILRWS